jgi:hypothetical protein
LLGLVTLALATHFLGLAPPALGLAARFLPTRAYHHDGDNH